MKNKKYENNFKSYLFKGNVERFIKICENIGIKANFKILFKKWKEELKK